MEEFYQSLNDYLHRLFFEEEINDIKLQRIMYETKNANNFDDKSFDLLIELITYLYSKDNNLEELVGTTLPDDKPSYDLESNTPFSEFRERLLNYKGLKHNIDKYVGVQNEDYYHLIIKNILNKVLIDTGYWYRIDSNELYNKEQEEEDEFKLYVPINNDSIHLFTLLFVLECEKNGLDYKVRFNASPSVQKGNNIEIISTRSNIKTYLDIIVNILNENVEKNYNINLDYRSLPPVAYPIQVGIGIVPILPQGEYADIICRDIIDKRDSTTTYTEFSEELRNIMEQYFTGIKEVFKEEFELDNTEINDEKKTTLL